MASRRGRTTSGGLRAATDHHQASDGVFVTAETDCGKVRGIDVGGIKTFRGIPFGASTAGRNRFMPPCKSAPWPGVRDAFDWGQIAPQVIASPAVDYVRLIEWHNQPGGMGEDVLTLNVWTRGVGDGANRPVMISFHGGGFTNGSSSHAATDGDPLARFADVVVVTVNHRIGALGYLHLGDLGLPPEFAQAGNAGMLDLVASLEWVRDNIAAFGGNPRNVMIFGYSGGGRKVSTLLAMPVAKGLFHRAAIQSGAQVKSMSRIEGTRLAEALLAELGVDKSHISKLQDLPFAQVLAAQTAVLAQGLASQFLPIVDGTILPQHPFDPTAPAVSASVPVIVSHCLTDLSWLASNFDLDDTGLSEVVAKLVGPDKMQRVVDLYLRRYPSLPPYLLQACIVTDRDVHRRSVMVAERKAIQSAAGGAPVWMYRFDWSSPGFGGKFGSVHAVDTSLVFNNADLLIHGDQPVAHKLADQLANAWVAFARTGNPADGNGFPDWPAYTTDRRETLVINERSRVVSDPGAQFRLLWEELGV